MQPATDKTVLGNFNNIAFSYAETTSTFFKRGNTFFVRTDDADGRLKAFEIKYTFGVSPLQQYLVELPGGRLQALSIAWDSRPAEQGGQRWFHLYPGKNITHGDALHWTGRHQNWNFMCAECHSTHLEKNYDPQQRVYRTTWSEINVSCEACHGPGAKHVIWANKAHVQKGAEADKKGLTHRFGERRNIRWTHDAKTGQSVRSAPRTIDTEIQVCAACHSRRAQLFEDDRTGQPLMDSFLPSLLDEGNYHSDGQIDGEVYEYGSFIQSRMYQAGVTCSDCHEPHGLKLRKPDNGVCLQCHRTEAYETREHHFHTPQKAGAHCVDCHMPPKNFMVIDARRDHSLRIPRPDLSARLGTPNACNKCHTDKTARWSAEKIRHWYGHNPRGYQNYAKALQAARSHTENTSAELIALLQDMNQPAIARATAARELQNWLNPESFQALATALHDTDPMVRLATLESLRPLPANTRWQLIRLFLQDPVRVVRISAAELLADIPAARVPAADREVLQAAIADYMAAQTFNADDPAAHVNLGNFYTVQGKKALAERSYRLAIDLDPSWVPAYVNLADLFRRMDQDSKGEQVLRSGIRRLPQAADLRYSLGLLLVRQEDLPAALVSLRQAADLAPANAHYSYVYAMALQNAGQLREARAVVDEALEQAPNDVMLGRLRSQLRKYSHE
nr:HEAT repeat domain-containing protein [Nitrococcus mobilis]